MSMDKKIENLAEEILQEYTNCYSEVDKEVLAKMISAAIPSKPSEWISVEDRLPKENEIERSFFDHETLALLDVETQLCSDEVLVVVRVIEENYAFVATDCTKEGKWLNWQYGDYEVTHWMPLPKAPKMTRKEDEGK